MGAKYNGKYCGNSVFWNNGLFSSYLYELIWNSLTDNRKLFEIMLSIDHMVGLNLPKNSIIHKKGKIVLMNYLILYYGFNLRPIEFEGNWKIHSKKLKSFQTKINSQKIFNETLKMIKTLFYKMK